MKETSYFTCTLGQAALLDQNHHYRTIPELIDHQAERNPDLPAIGTYVIREHGEWCTIVLSFGKVQRCTRLVAERLRAKLLTSLPGKTVALLAQSSLEFLFVWLGLMYLGRPVLLIAPQCSGTAVAHLCEVCEVETLFRDGQYTQLADDACEAAVRSGQCLEVRDMPFADRHEVFELATRAASSELRCVHTEENDVAYLHHTSGTSSGVPKPIPQTHRGGLGVLPHIDGSRHATFTTTPLYHGGIADLFRAWTSDALIWLFPAKEVPITSRNIVQCLDLSADAQGHDSNMVPRVSYFSSVPYVLQMLAADQSGLRHLQNMSMVGVGGAAMPLDAGNSLVERGVNLVSRFGSAECGFLLSSHRDFTTDKEWQYLRHHPEVKNLEFRPREDGLFELVVIPGWPHMAKSNRDDGSFATSDLFEPHPSIAHTWRYHSRTDSQLTLVTGKKFDPAPLEAAISDASDVVSDAMIFGEGEAYPGVLLFRTQEAAGISDVHLLRNVRPVIEEMNTKAQSHARIPLDMLVPMAPADLEKSSKGTLIRSAQSKRFASFIDTAYHGGISDDPEHVRDEEVIGSILDDVRLILPSVSDLTVESDLFAHGVDSVASIQISNKLSKLLSKDVKLPLTVVQDNGTIQRLAEHVIALRHGREPAGTATESVARSMEHFVKEFSAVPSSTIHIPPSISPPKATGSCGKVLLLTGATGTLGAHLLSHLLRCHPDLGIAHIYILVRHSNSSSPRKRIETALTSRGLASPDESLFSSLVTILPSSLSAPNLGLDATTYHTLMETVTHVYHLAWSVNFLLPLSAYQPHFAGLQNLLHLVLLCNTRTKSNNINRSTRLIFCSSTASVSAHSTAAAPTSAIPERPILAPQAAGPTGYARSKWVGEAICSAFARQHSCIGGVDDKIITVVRVGQLSGSSSTGCWNASEAYPLMLAASRELRVVPDLDGARRNQYGGVAEEECAWVPVDVAAEAFVQLLTGGVGDGCATTSVVNGCDAVIESQQAQDNLEHADDDSIEMQNRSQVQAERHEDGEVQVLHLLPRPGKHSSWIDILSCIFDVEPEAFRVVPLAEWLGKLEGLRREEMPQADNGGAQPHPALQLAGFWSETYRASSQQVEGGGHGDELSRLRASGEILAACHSIGNNNIKAEDEVEEQDEATVATGKDCDCIGGEEGLSGAAAAAAAGISSTRTIATGGFDMRRSLQAMPMLAARPAAVHLEKEHIARCWRWVKENV